MAIVENGILPRREASAYFSRTNLAMRGSPAAVGSVATRRHRGVTAHLRHFESTNMEQERPTADLERLRNAIHRVMDAARHESTKLSDAASDCEDESMSSLRDAHRKELDALQALQASLELFERRLPGLVHRLGEEDAASR